MTPTDIVRFIQERKGVWWFMPTEGTCVMHAELAQNPNLLTLWLAGKYSDQSHPFTFEVELVDEVSEGFIAIWMAVSSDYMVRFLVRDDKLDFARHS